MVGFGRVVIDRERYAVTIDGQPVALTFMEFNALWTIAEHEGRVVTYEQLAETLWGQTGGRSRRRLAVIISRIRSKLGEEGTAIETVTRVGYRVALGSVNSEPRVRDAGPMIYLHGGAGNDGLPGSQQSAHDA